jgi:apolipoprotein N-acyltransferase
VRGLGFWKGSLVGFVGGFSFYTAQIYWISQYLGPVPLIALAGLESVIFALAMGFIALTAKKISKSWLLSLLVATIWTGREWFATHFPYGGFPWSRVAMSQSDSPLANWVSIGGFGLLSFVLVAITIYFVESIKVKQLKTITKPMLTLAVVVLIPVLIAQTPAVSNGTIRVAGVQGNANAGLFANEVRGTIRDNHIAATETLVKSGKKFDLLVWPENASDIDPADDQETAEILHQLIDIRVQKPFIFGSITSDGDKIFNSSKLWIPGRGVVDQYDKKRPVPFGEYVPDRAFFYQLAPDLISMIYRGYEFGTRDGIFQVDKAKLGILICFEEAIDEVPRDVVADGAQVLIAQTNNADFGHSDESVQQLAIARLRAIETGRAIVSVSTVGPSAIIDRDGRLLSQSKSYVPAFVVADVPKYSDLTFTMRGGWLFDPIAAFIASAWCAWLVIDNRRKSTKL